MWGAVCELVILNDDEGSKESEDGGPIENCVDVSTCTFLLRRVGGLEDEDGLGGQEDARRVE